MSSHNPQVDECIKNRGSKWQAEMAKLRTIVLGCKLAEEIKWGWPCYSSDGRNVLLIHVFKEYCALLFFKGALLTDAHQLLVQPGEHTQAGRQIRFVSVQEINKLKTIVKAYVLEAIDVENSGIKVQLKKTSEFAIPDEFQAQLDQQPDLESAFNALTPGRQRAYLLYFAAPKQSKTRTARVEKFIAQILAGKGLNDS